MENILLEVTVKARRSVLLQFVHGDVVRFKSGGPKMTVLSQANANEYACKWYNQADGLFHESVFPVAELLPA